jgi:hypothetical protein
MPNQPPTHRTQSHLPIQPRSSPENLQPHPPVLKESHNSPTSDSIMTPTLGTIPPTVPAATVTSGPQPSMFSGASSQQQTAVFDLLQQAYPSIGQPGYNGSVNHGLGYMSEFSLIHDRTGMAYDITPEVYEAFSYVQPITTNMTSDYDSVW